MQFMKIKLRFEGVYSGWNASRLRQASFRRAPVDEVMVLSATYEDRYRGRLWDQTDLQELGAPISGSAYCRCSSPIEDPTPPVSQFLVLPGGLQ